MTMVRFLSKPSVHFSEVLGNIRFFSTNPVKGFLMSGDEYRDSLRRFKPRVFLNGRKVESVVDEKGFQPGVNAIALTYDYALKPEVIVSIFQHFCQLYIIVTIIVAQKSDTITHRH